MCRVRRRRVQQDLAWRRAPSHVTPPLVRSFIQTFRGPPRPVYPAAAAFFRARALLCARVGSCCLHFSGSRSLAAMISWTVTFYGVPNTEKGKFDLTPPQVQSVHRRHEIASPHPSSRRGRTSSPLVTLPVAGRSAGDEDEDATHACSFRENLSLRFLRTGRQILLTLPSS